MAVRTERTPVDPRALADMESIISALDGKIDTSIDLWGKTIAGATSQVA